MGKDLLEIKENVSLKPYNTFGLAVKAKFFVQIRNAEELKILLKMPIFRPLKKLYLGGGSNILLLNDFDGLVIKIEIDGIEVMEESESKAIIRAGAGVNWHSFVMFTIAKNWGGLENLSLIPGTVGAAPMQNIGAYGVEIKDSFNNLEALNLETLEIEAFDAKKCSFAYRESYFKREGKDKYVILYVSFELSKKPNLNIQYGAIQETLSQMHPAEINVKAVSEAVMSIRKSKLPDPAEVGNAGSFFKNPEIPIKHYEKLLALYPEMPSYPVGLEKIKVPAGWLIEQAGWKGKRFGNVGVHNKQALVLVNFGGGSGKQIMNLAEDIQKSVFLKFGVTISPEVNFVK
jgi:UDP-N-acetylmuramate dehydrogenase